MAKKARKSKASGAGAPRKLSASVKELIANMKSEQAAIQAEAERRSREKLQAVIDAKKAELAGAQSKARDAQKVADGIAKELDQLLSAAGIGGRRRGGRGASGRKPRVTMDRKIDAVAEALKKVGKGIEFAKLRDQLLALTDAERGGPIFARTDFNSAKIFGKKMLSKEWTVVGERKTARVERK